MKDINFFSFYKKQKSKSNGQKKFVIGVLAVFILGNIILIAVGWAIFRGYDFSIENKRAVINNQDTQTKMAEADLVKKEAALTSEYLGLLQSSSAKLALTNTLNKTLLDKVRSLTPTATSFTFAEYNGKSIKLECVSSVITDPMDMYHAFLNDPEFTSVTLSGINNSTEVNIQFNISCMLAGGESK